MLSVRYGGKTGKIVRLSESSEYVVVRTETRRSLAATPISRSARQAMAGFELDVRFEDAGVEVYRTKTQPRGRALRDRARAALKRERNVQFAGRVLRDARSGAPVVYTENFFVKFDDDASARNAKKLLARLGLDVKRVLEYARNAYFVSAPSGTGMKVFTIAEKLLRVPEVELCHPELVRRASRRAAAPAQWHLRKANVNGTVVDQSASVEAAWALADGTGTTIAIIDDGCDIGHEEFSSPGKIVAPYDATAKSSDPRPSTGDNHGTACAGVACADGNFGASGVAPRARLMPIRLASALGSQNEADAFIWAAQHGADVISCSWGPADGTWWDDSDPAHDEVVPLPDSTRLAIDWTIRNGRNGKGCVICWAAGNGNESADNDGYAKNPQVISVAACNDRGKRSAYSDFGASVWCAFPSSHGEPSLTPGIWTVDRSGKSGYNSGSSAKGDLAGNYTNSFGGTSSAAPGVAGVAALVLSHNPNLRWDEVRDILKRSADPIDKSGGAYNGSGHSVYYGYGRVNALRAVQLSVVAPSPDLVAVRSVTKTVPIADMSQAKLQVIVGDKQKLKALRVSVDIEHTYIGDLVVCLVPPPATGAAKIVLHNRGEGGTDNLKRTYDKVNAPGLAALVGKSPEGTWTLAVADMAKLDVGNIKSVALELTM